MKIGERKPGPDITPLVIHSNVHGTTENQYPNCRNQTLADLGSWAILGMVWVYTFYWQSHLSLKHAFHGLGALNSWSGAAPLHGIFIRRLPVVLRSMLKGSFSQGSAGTWLETLRLLSFPMITLELRMMATFCFHEACMDRIGAVYVLTWTLFLSILARFSCNRVDRSPRVRLRI